MAGRSALRASDADRERVADRLREAAAEGRILTEELEQRLEASFAARTYGQLDAVLADLPARRRPLPARSRERGWLRPTLALMLAATVALVVTLAVVLVVAGILATWVLWVVAGWFFFGRHRRHSFGGRHPGSTSMPRGWRCGGGRQHWV
jgi:hypothetical protein